MTLDFRAVDCDIELGGRLINNVVCPVTGTARRECVSCGCRDEEEGVTDRGFAVTDSDETLAVCGFCEGAIRALFEGLRGGASSRTHGA